ncbi:MAG: sulfatase-like hydrolase/transferase [Vicinamibacteria bacterium]
MKIRLSFLLVGSIVTGLLGLGILACRAPVDEVTSGSPNLILVTIDTLRADRVGVYGGREGLTPNLDALAKRGVAFLDTTAHAPLTLPSHASLLTGQFPSRHGVRDNAGYLLGTEAETLAEALGAAGYHTAAFVGAYVLNRRTGIAQGFETFVDRFTLGTMHLTSSSLERRGPELAAEAAEWLKNASPPFFLWLHLYDPHAPYEAPAAFAEQWPDHPYEAEVATSDWAMADLLRALPDGTEKHTLVVVTADHGESLGEHGEPEHGIFLYQATLQVPLIVAGPGLPEGMRIADPVRHVDVVPTVLHVLGVPPPGDLDGESLLPLVAGHERETVPISYAESAFAQLHFGSSDLRALRRGDWKYIEAPQPELYNLREDPLEKQNVQARHSEVVGGLRRELANVLRTDSSEELGRVDSAEADRLRSLGYVGGTMAGPTSATGDDPKDHIGDYVAYISTFNEALRALGKGDTEQALGGFGELVRRFPASFEAHQYMGRALAAQGDFPGALEAYEAAIHLNPRSGTVYLDAALSLAARKDFEEAFAYVEQGRKVEPESFYGFLIEGTIARQAGRDEQATRAFQAALSINPDLAMADYQLGEMAVERGDTGEAAAHFRNALRIDPFLEQAREALGRLEEPH